MLRYLGWLAIVLVYILTLVTQLPHIYDVYSALERNEHSIAGIDTALGASIAFEASVAIFTLRTIVNRKSERSRWTRPGVIGFLLMSALANTSYYFNIETIDNQIMPAVLAIAIPLALWLYAEEFGADAKAAVRAQRKTQPARNAPQQGASNAQHICWCGASYASQQALAAHGKAHKNEVRAAESMAAALEVLMRKYPDAWKGDKPPVTEQDVMEWRK